MLGKSVLVYSPTHDGGERLLSTLRSAGNEVALTTSVSAACELVNARAIDILVAPLCWQTRSLMRVAVGRLRVVAVANNPNSELSQWLIEQLGVVHAVVATHHGRDWMSAVDSRLLTATVKKALHRDPFGLRKYLADVGVSTVALAVQRPSDRSPVLRAVTDRLVALGLEDSVVTRMARVISELITGAKTRLLAPGTGRIGAHRSVSIEFGSDGHWFGVSVVDRGEQLSPQRVRWALRHGAGMAIAAKWSTALVCNVEPGRRTEVLALLDLSNPPSEQASVGSVQVFLAASDGSLDSSRASGDTVLLSESLRHRLRRERCTVADPPWVGPPVPSWRRRIRSFPAVGGATLELNRDGRAHDTVVGLLRGAQRRDAALETVLRFLTTDYRAAVVFLLHGEVFVPHFAAGQVHDWAALACRQIALDEPCTMSELVADARVRSMSRDRYALDAWLCRVLVGDAQADAVSIPVLVAGSVCLVLCVCAPRLGHSSTQQLTGSLRPELERTLARVVGKPYELFEVALWPHLAGLGRSTWPSPEAAYVSFEVARSP